MQRWVVSIALTAALAGTAAAPCAETTVETVVPGLIHNVLTRGETAAAPSYRILLGAFERQSDADKMLERLRDSGCGALPTSDGAGYRVVTPGLPHRSEAEALRQRLIERGFSPPLEIQEVRHDLTHPQGPWSIHVLKVDPTLVEVRVAHAYDAAIGLETTAELASRRGAAAAVNGGYFVMEGPLAGDSRGVLQIDGKLVSEPDRGRAAVGFFDHGGTVRAVFGRLAFRGEAVLADGQRIRLDGLNRARGQSEIILYTPDFHRTTLTPPGGLEVVIDGGIVREIRGGDGSSVIPPAGCVLSIDSERVREVLPRVARGQAISLTTELLPLLPDPEGEWRKADDIIGGGPLLLWKGERIETPEEESISDVFCLARHPRTAVGARADGTLLFVTVDGRRPEASVGMSLPELTDLLLELGAVSAINLDGGGSTTMVIGGRVVNRPSGLGPRRNGDAILLFPRTREVSAEQR